MLCFTAEMPYVYIKKKTHQKNPVLVFHMAAGTVYTVCLTTQYTREMVDR